MTMRGKLVRLAMRVTTIKRRISKIAQARTTKKRIVFQFSREFFAREDHTQFAIEMFLFGALLAICASPMIAAVVAISRAL
jgi:hypothetical protein